MAEKNFNKTKIKPKTKVTQGGLTKNLSLRKLNHEPWTYKNWWATNLKIVVKLNFIQSEIAKIWKYPHLYLPWNASCFHMIGQRDIMWPDIILPFLKSNNTTQNIPRMHANTHVDVNSCGVSHFSVMDQKH